jgi:hypothetical protein
MSQNDWIHQKNVKKLTGKSQEGSMRMFATIHIELTRVFTLIGS